MMRATWVENAQSVKSTLKLNQEPGFQIFLIVIAHIVNTVVLKTISGLNNRSNTQNL